MSFKAYETITGSVSLTHNQTTSSTSFVDVLGGSLTLPYPGVYNISYIIRTINNTANNSNTFRVLSPSSAIIPNSYQLQSNTAAFTTSPCVAKFTYTSSVPNEIIKLQWLVSAGIGTILNSQTLITAGGESSFSYTLTGYSPIPTNFQEESNYITLPISYSVPNATNITTANIVTGMNFTIPSAGRWVISYKALAQAVSGATLIMWIGETTTPANILQDTLTTLATSGIATISCPPIYITTTGAKNYSLYAKTAATGTIWAVASSLIAYTGVGALYGTHVSYQKIGSYLPLVGKTVKYGMFRITNDQSSGAGTDITGANSWFAIEGNMSVTSAGVWSLTAGITYQLSAYVGVTSTTECAMRYAWVDAITNTQIVNIQGSAYTLDYSNVITNDPISTLPCVVTYTPLIDQNVKLRIIANNGNVTIASGGVSGGTGNAIPGTSVSIVQISGF